jgi:hypothetical protein
MPNSSEHTAISRLQLLNEFIQEKATSYQQPSRKGTPRGEPVGFSWEKYYATLLALTEDSLEDQANKLDVSYHVLRKWRSEPEFKKTVQDHMNVFVQWLTFKHFNTPGRDWRSAVLNLANSWNRTIGPEDRKQQNQLRHQKKDSINRLTLSLLSDALENTTAHSKTCKELQVAALGQIIELLQDRAKTIRYRREIAKVLSTIKKNLTGKESQETGQW